MGGHLGKKVVLVETLGDNVNLSKQQWKMKIFLTIALPSASNVKDPVITTTLTCCFCERKNCSTLNMKSISTVNVINRQNIKNLSTVIK